MDPKIVNAVSMESLDTRSIDNCSTISSFEQPSSQVRTLFISGLPMDCKSRELYLLFRGCQGYEGSSLKPANKNGKMAAPVGFVTFLSRQDAEEACRKLQGVRFDPENSQTIRVEWARSTTKVSKPKQPSPPIISPANLPTIIPQHNLHAALAATAPTFIPQAQQQADLHSIMEQLPYDQSQLFGLSLAQALQCSAAASPLIVPNSLATAMAHLQQQQHLNGLINAVASVPSAQLLPQTTSGNPPCTTLFIANLGSNTNEEEIKGLFKSQPGFSRLRMHHKSGPGNMGNSGSVCFVEFLSVPHATMAYMNLQGYQLSNQSCIRIEYAKAKMGEKGETNNNGSLGIIKTNV